MLLLLHGGTVFTQPSPTQLLVRKIFLFLVFMLSLSACGGGVEEAHPPQERQQY